MSRTYTNEELNEILNKHAKWIRDEEGGDRANLYGANLSRANLYGANLYGANLYDADLSGADLYDADLSGADLYDADLSGANLYGANLYDADLSGANLSRANLSRADLSGADLDYWIVPEEDAFTGYKAVRSSDGKTPVVLKLEVPADSVRSCCYSSRKVRVSKARAIAAFHKDGTPHDGTEFISFHDPSFIWRLGELNEVPDFKADPTVECGPGLHLFVTRKEAVDWS